MKKFLLILGILVFLISCGKERNGNVKLPLSDEEIEKALEYGEKNVSLTYTEFTEKWAVDLGYKRGKGRAVIVTPFLRVALMGKKAAKQNERIEYSLIKKVLLEEPDKLYFEVMLYGNSPEFGRTVKAKLKYDGREFSPVYLYFPHYSQMSRDYTQIVAGRIKFLKGGIPDDAKITLIISFSPSNDKDRVTCKFDFNLKELK